MEIVSYNMCCCNCCKINGTRGIITVNDSVEDYLFMTEFEFSKLLEKWTTEMELACRFCGSNNVYGENIEIGSKKLYDFDSIVKELKNSGQNGLLIYSIIKENGRIKKEVGGKAKNDSDFILDCWPFIIGELNKIPQNKFKKNELDSEFQISVSGVLRNGVYEFKIHRLKICGFERKEVIAAINEYITKYPLA